MFVIADKLLPAAMPDITPIFPAFVGATLVLSFFTSRLMSGSLPPTLVDSFSGHPRAVIISDIGNEPDDQMSLVRLLLYSNEIDIEALIASTSTWQKSATPAHFFSCRS
jgi:cellulose-binding protein